MTANVVIPYAAQRDSAAPIEASDPVAISIAGDAEDYSRAVKGVDIKVTRTGRGDGPTTVSTVRRGSFVATSTSIGFPMASRTTMGDDVVLAACITSAPPGSRWCGIDLDAGTMLMYGPGAG